MNTGFLSLYSHILSYLVRKTGQSSTGPLRKYKPTALEPVE